MYRRILVPLDGSRTAECALPWAGEIASRHGSELLLVHAHSIDAQTPILESITPYRYEHITDADREADEVDRKERLDRLRLIADLAGARHGVHASAHVIHGPAATSLTDMVASEGADLVVMSAHGASPRVSRLGIGRVADHLVRHAVAPVLLVRPDPYRRDGSSPVSLDRILVPLDGSPQSQAALPFVRELAQPFGSGVTLLRVLRDRHRGLNSLATQVETRMEEQAARVELNDARRCGLLDGLSVNVAVAIDTRAARAILTAAVAGQDDVIALASRGRGALRRAVLGSVSSELMRFSTLPLLLIGPAAEPKPERMERLGEPAATPLAP